MAISGIDITIIALYLVFILGLGFYLGKGENADGFFVNSGKTKFFLLLFTALSTSVGASTFIGLASASYDSGVSFGISVLIITTMGWGLMAWLAPRIKEFGNKVGAYTLGDFFVSRYSSSTRTVASLMIVISYSIITAVQFVAFARLAEVISGVGFVTALTIGAFVTISYTIFSGMKGDIYTDAIQFFLMAPIFIFLLVAGFSQIGFSDFVQNIPPDFLSPTNYAGPVFLFGSILFGFPLILSFMDVWQRVFAAIDAKTARRAFIWTSVLKVLIIVAVIIIGLLAFQIVPGTHKDLAVFTLMTELLPTGILGLGFASVLAILMSTIDSMLMVGAATITKDFYLAKNPKATEKEKLKMGRSFVLLFGLGGFLLALGFQDIVRLGVTSAQVLAVFLPALIGGLLWRRSTSKAAFWSIIIGFITTIALFPLNPDTGFIPAVILSIIIFIWLSLAEKPKKIV